MSRKKMIKTAVAVPVIAIALLACMHMGMLASRPKPPASEFGYGPCASATGQYRVTIQENGSFTKGKLLSTAIQVAGQDGKGIEGLRIGVDGGMPQHSHGLVVEAAAASARGLHQDPRITGRGAVMQDPWNDGDETISATFRVELVVCSCGCNGFKAGPTIEANVGETIIVGCSTT